MFVQFIGEEFQFFINGKATGQYARGRIIKEHKDSNTFLIECLSDGKRYEMSSNEFIYI